MTTTYRVLFPMPECGALEGDCIVDDPVEGRATLARSVHRNMLAAAIERGDVAVIRGTSEPRPSRRRQQKTHARLQLVED